MSRYDRQRERKRFLIIATIVLTFGGIAFLWGSNTNDGFANTDRITQQKH